MLSCPIPMKEENILYLARGFSQRSLSAGMLSRPMTASLSVYSMAEQNCTGTLVCSGLQVAHMNRVSSLCLHRFQRSWQRATDYCWFPPYGHRGLNFPHETDTAKERYGVFLTGRISCSSWQAGSGIQTSATYSDWVGH